MDRGRVNSINQPVFISWRFYVVLSVIILAATGLLWRIFDLAVLDQHFLRHEGDERVLRLIKIPAFRGMIMDRNGFPLAVSTPVSSLWIHPEEFSPDRKTLKNLADLLSLKTKDIQTLVHGALRKKRAFVYLKRGLSPELASQIKMLDIAGLYAQEEYRRYYPEGEVFAHVIGFTNVDDHGQEGLELGFNDWLAGNAGEKWVVKDRLGRIISDIQLKKEQKPGHDLLISIDKRIQYLAYKELLAGVTQNKANSGSAVVLDAKTGEILALVNQPSFNPNQRGKYKVDRFRNRAVTDTFEPGSTIKAFTVASALESKRYKLNSVVNTSPGWLHIGRNLVRDERDNGPLTLTQILQISSNVGAAKIVLSLPQSQLWSLLHRVGFGEITGVQFPGEQNGSLTNYDKAFALATMSFGYGLSATTLQLARAYSVLANEGRKIPITLIKQKEAPLGERVLDAKVAKEMLALLEAVVEKGGTGEAAHVPGYRVAGKTGTAKRVGLGGYQKHRYTSSFVGIAPLSNPRLIVAVVIHDPLGKNYYGGLVSGPVFEKIMEGALRILSVPPDADVSYQS